MNENQNANMSRKEYNKLQAEQIENSSSVFDGKEFLLRLADVELPSGSTTIWDLPDGYIFKDENGNIINATKIVLEKKSVIREEQIDNAAQEYIDSDNAVLTYSDGFCEQTDHPFVRAAFKAGVEWAANNVTQDDCSKAPKLTSQDYSNGRFGYQLPAGFEAKLTERELILTPEKPKYPKTYKECCAIIGAQEDRHYFYTKKDKEKDYPHEVKILKLLDDLRWILICRDAYWQIAGEEMGLGKPWKPDWNHNTEKYVIYPYQYLYSIDVENYRNTILAFPTEEMRNAFYENFKELIEQCKELL